MHRTQALTGVEIDESLEKTFPADGAGRSPMLRALLRLRAWGGHLAFATGIVASVGAVAWFDLATGPGREAAVLYILPILFSAAAWGVSGALLCGCVCSAVFVGTLVSENELFPVADALQTATFPVMSLVLGGLASEYLRAWRLQEDLAKLNAELEDRIRVAVASEREAQTKLGESQRLAMLGEAAAHVAHEIRNPLIVLGGFTRRAVRLISPEHPASKDLAVVMEESERLERLLGDILEFSRPTGCADPEPVPVKDLLQEIAGFVGEKCERAGVRLSVSDGEIESLRVPGDREALKRVLLNLVLNAMDAMPGGGELLLDASATLFDHTPGVSVKVRDTGSGMPPEVLRRVFEPFFTTKRGGTGIGLPMVKKTVGAHGGRVEIKSTLGGGTAVTILLPGGSVLSKA